MEKRKVVFVILHYLVEDTTIQCIESIRKNIDTDSYEIVVVDNASGNGSGEKLQQKYRNERRVTVIINKENAGFSKGNNIGFKYAKKQWNPDYIVLLNNDILLLEKDFVKKIENEYKDRKYAVLGPMVITKDAKCDTNPMKERPLTKKELLSEVKAIKRVLFMNKLHLSWFYVLLSDIKKKLKKENEKNLDMNNHISIKENVQLHGCFLVLSKKYIDKFDGLEERTFFYREEEILYYNVVREGMTLIYVPNIIVFHEEFAASNALSSSNRKKIETRYNRMLNASLALLEMYEEYKID